MCMCTCTLEHCTRKANGEWCMACRWLLISCWFSSITSHRSQALFLFILFIWILQSGFDTIVYNVWYVYSKFSAFISIYSVQAPTKCFGRFDRIQNANCRLTQSLYSYSIFFLFYFIFNASDVFYSFLDGNLNYSWFIRSVFISQLRCPTYQLMEKQLKNKTQLLNETKFNKLPNVLCQIAKWSVIVFKIQNSQGQTKKRNFNCIIISLETKVCCCLKTKCIKASSLPKKATNSVFWCGMLPSLFILYSYPKPWMQDNQSKEQQQLKNKLRMRETQRTHQRSTYNIVLL